MERRRCGSGGAVEQRRQRARAARETAQSCFRNAVAAARFFRHRPRHSGAAERVTAAAAACSAAPRPLPRSWLGQSQARPFAEQALTVTGTDLFSSQLRLLWRKTVLGLPLNALN